MLKIHRFVDRDMIMQFCGGGVGHKSMHPATDQFLDDHDHAEKDCKDNDSADQDNSEFAKESEDGEAGLQQWGDSDIQLDRIEQRIEDEVDPGDECDYGYNKQMVDDDNEEGWENEDEDLGFLHDDVLGAEDGEGDDDDMGFGEF
jgi:hypothetical protein